MDGGLRGVNPSRNCTAGGVGNGTARGVGISLALYSLGIGCVSR